MSDDGYHLTQQWLVKAHLSDYRFGMTWFSDFIGCAWLYVTGDPGLIAARAGLAVMIATTALAAFWIVSSQFTCWASCLSVVGTAIAINYHGTSVINYHNLSSLFLLVASGLLLAVIESSRPTVWRLWLASIAGLWLGFAAMAKAPLILAVVLPILVVVVSLCVARRDLATMCAAAVACVVGEAAAILICLTWLYSHGRLGEYLASYHVSDESYAISVLLREYFTQGLTVFVQTLAFIVLLPVLAILCHRAAIRLRRAQWAVWLYFFTLLAVTLGLRKLLGTDAVVFWFHLALPGFALAAAAFCIIAEWQRSPLPLRSALRMTALSFGLCIPVLVMAGSNNGIVEMRYGLWLALPLAVLLLPSAIVELFSGHLKAPPSPDVVRPYVISTFVALVVISAGIHFVNPYRDLRNRFMLTARLNDPRLTDIHTSASRARSVDELIAEVEKRTKPNDHVLAYHRLGMVNYVTRTVPALEIANPTYMSAKWIQAALNEIGTTRPMPKLVIRTKTNTMNCEWAVEDVAPPGELISAKVSLIDEAVRHLGYREVWSNKDFSILERPRHTSSATE